MQNNVPFFYNFFLFFVVVVSLDQMMSRLIAVVVHVTMCPSVYHCPFFSSEWNVCLVFTIIRLPSSIFLTNNKKQQQQHQKPLFLENGFQAPLLGATLLYNKKKYIT